MKRVIKINIDKDFLNEPITKKTFLSYSILFFITCIVIYSYYFISKGSFIWKSDGFTQHFQLFDEYIDILHGVLRGEGFSQWDWSIGPGADTITSYGYYVIGDPFVYLGVLFPENLREFSFHLLVFARMWCVGLSYLVFARKFKVSHGAGLLGAFMYTFSFFVIYNAKRHPFFILALIWYPLLCLGVEKILRKESGLLFSIMIAVSAIANFYFFYKLTILTFIYALVRYQMLYGFRNFKQLASFFGGCVLHYISGLLISSFIFLPMVDGFLRSSRNIDGVDINLFLYHISYYIELVHNLFVPYSYLWSVGGFSIFALFTIVFLLKVKREKIFSATMILVLGVFLLFPFLGSFMNGLSGPYNRFSFAIPLFLSLASGQFLEERNKLKVKGLGLLKRILIAFTFFYVTIAIMRNMYVFYISPIIFGWIIWYILVYEIGKDINKEKTNKISVLLVVIVLVNMATNAMNLYYPYGANSISNSVELNTSISRYENLYDGMENLLPEEGIYRIGVTSRDNQIRNQFIYHNLMGLNSYLSITNAYLSDFAKEMEIASYQIIQPLRNGLDDRRIINHFFSIRYILTEERNEPYLPEGYKVINRSNGNPNFILAKTDADFPFAYVEDTIMERELFSKLNPIEKEVFLSQGVVLENQEDFPLFKFEEKPQLKEQVREVDYKIEYNDPNVQLLDDGSIEVKDRGASFKVLFKDVDKLAGNDVFIYLQGLNYEDINKAFYMPEDSSYNLSFLYEGKKKTFRQSNKYSFSSYFKRENIFVNLGHTYTGRGEMDIQFKDRGKYKIDDIKVYALGVNETKDKIIASKKRDNALDIDVFENETIRGTIQREKPGILVTTIPYAKGWKIEVNGEKKQVVKANIGFIGVGLDGGSSEVVFSYQNPYLKIGSILTMIGIVILGLNQIIYQKVSKK